MCISSQGSSQGSPAPLFTVRCATPVETRWQKGSGRGASVFLKRNGDDAFILVHLSSFLLHLFAGLQTVSRTTLDTWIHGPHAGQSPSAIRIQGGGNFERGMCKGSECV